MRLQRRGISSRGGHCSSIANPDSVRDAHDIGEITTLEKSGMWEGERVPFYKVVGIISNGICSLSFALTTYGRKNNPFIFYEREFEVSLMGGPHGGPFGACVNSPAFFWVLGFMPLSFWMVPFSLSLSLLSPSPFPLISIADQRARRGLLRCSALPGYWIYCIWLRSGFALPLPSLCLPPVCPSGRPLPTSILSRCRSEDKNQALYSL